MAAIIPTLARIGVPAVLGFIRRNQIGLLFSAVGLGELVDFLQIPGNDAEKAKVPRFAIVDLKKNDIIKTLTKDQVFRFLTRPRRPQIRTKTIVIRQPSGGVHPVVDV